MSKARRRLTVPAIVGIVALCLSSCAQGSATTTTTPAGGGSLVRYMEFSASGGHEKDLANIAKAFHAANPTITVQIDTIPFADYFTKLQTAVAGGTAGDAFELNYENFVSYAKSGSLTPLQNVDPTTYKKSLLNAFTYNGKQLGLPESFSNEVLFYNKNLFAAAGVPLPTATWTWKDEQAAAQKLTNKAKGVWGDYQPITFDEFYKVLAQSGGSFLNKDGTKTAFNSPAGVAAANWLVAKSGKTMPTEADGAGTPDYDTNLFSNGKLAIWHSGIWMFSTLANAKFGWDVAVEPGNTTKASALFTNGVMVNAASKNKAAAQKWISFLSASSAMVKIRLATSWELPTVADQSELAPYLNQPKPANRKAVFEALNATVLSPVIDSQQQMQDIVTQELGSAAAGRESVAKALANAQSQVNALLK
jgi:multiple sugar transport system substrate-binding protein